MFVFFFGTLVLYRMILGTIEGVFVLRDNTPDHYHQIQKNNTTE